MTDAERLHTTRHELVVYALVFLGWAALWMASRQWAFLVPLALVFLLHPVLKRRIKINPSIVVYALLALPVLALHQYNPIRGVGGNRFNNSFYGSFGTLLYAALTLYSPVDRVRLPRILLFTAVATGFSGAALPEYVGSAEGPTRWEQTSLLGPLTPGPHVFFAGLTAVYGVVALVALQLSRRQRLQEPTANRGRLVVFVLSVLITAGVTAGGSWLERTYYEDVSQAWQRVAMGESGGGGGFSDQADLNSVSNTRTGDARQVALRVFAPREPGYLRGKAFVDYVGRGWDVSWPATEGALVLGRYPFPEGREVGEAEEPFLTVHPAEAYAEQFFLPLETCAVDTTCERVALHAPGYTLRSLSGATTRGYGVFVSDGPLHAEADLDAYLAMPRAPAKTEELVAALDAFLARTPFPEDANDELVKDVIAGQFRMHYTYEVGVKFLGGVDPLVQFLGEDLRRGHCELFASAGALLLRRKGIPARYVTGFVVQERGFGEQWLARNAYAHAWVEYYTPERGWQVAEFTPPGGVPQAVAATGLQSLLDWVGGVFEQGLAFVIALPGRIGAAVRAAFTWLTAAWWRVVLVVLAVVGVFVWRTWKRPQGAGERRRAREFTGDVAVQRERYLALQSSLKRAGLDRAGHETLLEYATRLEGETFPEGLDRTETLSFLRAFAQARYAAAVT